MFGLPDLKFDIVYDNISYPLIHSPIGWEDINIEENLDDFFQTTWSKVASDLRFQYDGAEVLSKIYFTNGPNSIALFRIYKLNKDTLEYEQKIRQIINFREFSQENDVVSVGLIDEGIESNIRSYMDVQYTIPVNYETNAIDLNIGGIGIGERATFISGTESTQIGLFNFFCMGLDLLETNVVGNDIIELNDGYNSATVYLGNLSIFDYNYFMTVNAPEPFQLRLKGNIKGGGIRPGYSSGTFFTRYLIVQDNFDVNQTIATILDEGPQFGRPAWDVDFDTLINVIPGRKYTIGVFSDLPNNGSPNTRFSVSVNSFNMTIDYSTYTLDYASKGLRSFDLLKALLKQINPGRPVNVVSNILENGSIGKRIVIASGDCIRNILEANIQTSLRDFLESMMPQLMCGFKVMKNGDVIFDHLSEIQFNRFKFIGHLGVVKNPKYETINEVFAGKYTVGYNDNNYDKADGRDEFNTEENRSVIDTKSTNNVEIKSLYRADPRGIDDLILNYREDKTKDNSGDKQNFKLVVNETIDEDDNKYHLTGPEIYKSVEGTSALGRIYNLEISPIMMFLRNTAKIAIQFAVNKIGSVKFESSKKNAELKITNLDDTIISTKQNVSYEQMNFPLYLPIKCTFTAVMTDLFYEKIISDPNNIGGYITYNDGDKLIKGFIVKSSYNLTNNNIKEFTVYIHPEEDLSNLYIKN